MDRGDGKPGYPVRHFAIAVPEGSDEGVPGLLRRAADAISEMGPVEVLAINYCDCVVYTPSITVYFAELDDSAPASHSVWP